MSKHIHLTKDQIKEIHKEMPKANEIDKLSNFFKVFGNDTRVKILFTLQGRNLCVHDISETLGMSQSAISHQLKTLREATLVKFKRDGSKVIYSLDDDHIEQIFTLGLEHIRE